MHSEHSLTVWTEQGYDLNRPYKTIDPSKSPYIKKPKIHDRIQDVNSVLGSNQIIWCSQQRDEPIWVKDGAVAYLHEILVDERDIAVTIDSFIWNHIIKTGKRYVLPEDMRLLRNKYINNGISIENLEEEDLEDECLANNLPSDGNLWGNLGRVGERKGSDQILLRFPFQYHSLILPVDEFTAESLKTKKRKRS